MRETAPLVAPNEFSVITWNILLDKTRTKQGLMASQAQRLDSQIETLSNLGVNLDVVTLQEVEKTKDCHSGEITAQVLGFRDSFWFEHNTSKRKGEHIGMFGNLVSAAESLDLKYDKKAVITRVGEVAIVGIHHRKEFWGQKRTWQMLEVVDAVKDIDQVVIMGDSNALFFEESRFLLRQNGFRSAFTLAGQRRPMTHPTTQYKDIIQKPWHNAIFPRGKSLDIIEVRGMDVKCTGTFEGDSDHVGEYAVVASR